MDTSRLLFLIFMVITTSECSGTTEPKCQKMDKRSYTLLEGEAFYLEPYDVASGLSDEDIEWYKNETKIPTDKNENVHYHGEALFFLNLLPENSGNYTAWETDPSSGKCYKYDVEVNVVKSSYMKNLLYGEIKNSDMNKMMPCPDPVNKTCQRLKGKFRWNKDNKPLQGHDRDHLWIANTSKDDEGIYTCICTWTYNGKEYNSSASRELKVEDKVANRGLKFISPNNKEQLADEGVGIKLNCSVFCGTTKISDCNASWMVDGIHFPPINGYNQTTKTVTEKPSMNTFSTAILTIEKVSAKDFKTEFKCSVEGMFEKASAPLTLRRRESIIPLVIGAVCVLFFVVLAAMLVKCFAIDLTLFFRSYFPLSSYNKDGRVYDAYVVYHMQSMDKATEDALCQFVNEVLPSVLEEKCGYRLFIHGRDDIPGEDRLELVEERMKQSRRLMVILTPGSGSELQSRDQCPASPQNSMIGGFDWQVGLHHALFQREMSVILVQLGATGPQGYTHLPAGLQHLILQSAPIKWPEGSSGAAAWNSRFWKRVRYLMPAIPAIKCPQSAII
ncbi:interleukin-1 receptor-like 1 [Perca fluviatilis]|uniref:interleukin-1 receptor-like 1 n=1 Tax=Perca fluviatilis TaxID=8168 RepID=UPI00196420CD|nr:interleukin-1 receptor-like 1 [Perca fluviatilis]XP_039673036.1 interleukin-1 receptor-like 1 [Perca fluviatilis]